MADTKKGHYDLADLERQADRSFANTQEIVDFARDADQASRDMALNAELQTALTDGRGRKNVAALIDMGANIDAPRRDGQTELTYRVENGDTAQIKQLLDLKANPYERNAKEQTAVKLAEKQHNYTLAEELKVSAKANGFEPPAR